MSAGDLRSNVAGLLLELTPIQMRALRAEAWACRGSLTIPQFRMLVRLAEGPQCNKGLAQLLEVSIPAASRMVLGLVQAGLIERSQGQNGDRRKVLLSLTAEGRKRVDLTRRHVRSRFAERLGDLSETELAAAQAGLESLQALFRRESELRQSH